MVEGGIEQLYAQPRSGRGGGGGVDPLILGLLYNAHERWGKKGCVLRSFWKSAIGWMQGSLPFSQLIEDEPIGRGRRVLLGYMSRRDI